MSNGPAGVALPSSADKSIGTAGHDGLGEPSRGIRISPEKERWLGQFQFHEHKRSSDHDTVHPERKASGIMNEERRKRLERKSS